MSIIVTELKSEFNSESNRLHVAVLGEISIERFRELVQRAVNLWPDVHPEVKEFADKVTEGKVQQNYQEQEYYKLVPTNRYTHYHKCPTCQQVSGIQTISPVPPSYSVKCDKLVAVEIPRDASGNTKKLIPCGVTALFRHVS